MAGMPFQNWGIRPKSEKTIIFRGLGFRGLGFLKGFGGLGSRG